jgi:O-antigen/teichoic acid export membrane protein
LVRYTYGQFFALAVLSLGVAIVMPLVVVWLLDPSFAASAQFVPWFALGFWFSGMYYMVTNYLFYARRTAWLATATGLTAVVNVALTYVLILANGAVGAAQATAISFAMSFFLTWIASQLAYPMPWLGGRLARPPT